MSNLEVIKEALEIALENTPEELKSAPSPDGYICDIYLLNQDYIKIKEALPLLDEAIAERDRLGKALEYAYEHINDHERYNVKQVINIALEREPRLKILYSNLGDYFVKAR